MYVTCRDFYFASSCFVFISRTLRDVKHFSFPWHFISFLLFSSWDAVLHRFQISNFIFFACRILQSQQKMSNETATANTPSYDNNRGKTSGWWRVGGWVAASWMRSIKDQTSSVFEMAGQSLFFLIVFFCLFLTKVEPS